MKTSRPPSFVKVFHKIGLFLKDGFPKGPNHMIWMRLCRPRGSKAKRDPEIYVKMKIFIKTKSLHIWLCWEICVCIGLGSQFASYSF